MSLLDSALVLFSGGQDSTVCLAWALERFARVETIGFDYGQRHAVELEVRPRIRERLSQFSERGARGSATITWCGSMRLRRFRKPR